MGTVETYTASRRGVLRGGAALLAAGFIGVNFEQRAGAQSSTPVGSDPLSGLGLPELTISTTDAEFTGVPDSVVAGRYLVTFKNASQADETASFLLLPDGVAPSDLSAPVTAAPSTPATPVGDVFSASPEASPAADQLGGPPSWYYTTTLAGGPGAAAGQTGRAVIDLAPGNWVVWSDDPTSARKPVAFSVTAATAASPSAQAAPTAQVTVNEVKTDTGFMFNIDGDFSEGVQVVRILNQSDQPHFFLLLQSPSPVTQDQVLKLFGVPDSATPNPAEGVPDPDTFTTAAYAGTLSAGGEEWIEVNLLAGTYIAACFVGDPTKNGAPHATEGMVDVITIETDSDATPVPASGS
jgi:hypothetical protein